MKIRINGTEVTTDKTELTYEEVVYLGGKPLGPTYSMTYAHAHDDRSGSLMEDESVRLAEGTSFMFMVTGNG